jgi:Xaa-Pro dipeptidase
LPDSYLTYNIPTDTLTLFIPPIEPDSVIWAGLPVTSKEALEQYDVDKVLPTPELNAHLVSFSHSPTTVYAISEQVSEHVTFLGFKATEFGILKKAIEDTRVCKDAYEIALLRRANEISTLAHMAVVRQARSAQNERELEGTFIATCIANGCREQSYHSIVASGTSASTLHYLKNDQPLKGKLNILLDAGGEYNCYCADITRTFPISGTFSPESKEIYDIVLEMQESCFKMLKEGVSWEDVHVNAHKVAISGLKEVGILKGSEEDLLDKRISVAFFPHGLGHYLGMDTHDTGGNPNYEDKDSMFRYLRVRYVAVTHLNVLTYVC